MKIQLFFIDYYNKNSSGLTTYVKQLTDSFSNEKRINLSYINVNTKFNTNIERHVIEDVVHYQYPKEIQISEINLNNTLIHLLKNDIDVNSPTIFHFNWINHAPFAQLLKNNFECTTLLTKHCIPWRDNITGNYNVFARLNRSFNAKIEYYPMDHVLHREYIAYTSVDHIICVTEFAKRSLTKMFGICDDKISVIYNGLKVLKSHNKKKDDLKIKYGFTTSDKLVLFAGNLNLRKGIVDLVESFKLVLEENLNARLIISGNGDYNAIVNAAGNIWAKITITGNLDIHTLQDFYHMADIGIVPSYVEQCSYTAIEMMHANLPIIVTDVDGLSEIVPNNGGLKVPLLLKENKAKVDTTELTYAICKLLKNPIYSSQLAQKAKVHALNKLNSDIMSAETLKIYWSLWNNFSGQKLTISKSRSLGKIAIIICFVGTLIEYRSIVNNILNQNYADIKIILFISEIYINDITSIFEDKKQELEFVSIPKRKSIVSFLNQTILDCEEEFVSIISKNGVVRPDRFEQQINILLDDITLDFVGSNCFTLDKMGIRNGIIQFPRHSEDCRVLNIFQNTFELTNVLFRTKSLKKVKLKSFGLRIDETRLWFELLKKQIGINIDGYLTSIYINRKLSSKSNNTINNHIADILEDQLEYYGITYDTKDLALHFAIYFGYKRLYFDHSVKHELLTKWLNQLLTKLKVNKVKDKSRLSYYIKQHLCNVD